MQIKSNGAVPFSLRKRDVDLINLVTSLPKQEGSEVLRELLRDGLAYQKLVSKGQLPETRLTSLIQYLQLNLIEAVKEEKEVPADIPAEVVPVEKAAEPIPAPAPDPVKPEPEEVEEVEEIDDETDPGNFFTPEIL